MACVSPQKRNFSQTERKNDNYIFEDLEARRELNEREKFIIEL